MLPEFIANGGDKYSAVTFKKYGHIDAGILKDYIAGVKELNAIDYQPRHYVRYE